MFQCHGATRSRQSAASCRKRRRPARVASGRFAATRGAASAEQARQKCGIMTGHNRQILVIGYGEMGHAMEFLLAGRGTLCFHDILPMAGHESVELESAASQADRVIYCVPVTPLAGLARRVAPMLGDHRISLSVAKGLDDKGRPAARIFRDVNAERRDYAVLYGPMIAEEIRAGRPAFAQVGASRAGVYERVAALFAGTGLALQYSSDIQGISWASVLKNVYALLFGAADELGLGDNMRGYLAVAAQAEMARILARMGGRDSSARQLAGLGDLITTATSAGSHHHDLGSLLARGERDRLSGEGIHTLAMVRRYGLIDTGDFPLFRLVQELVQEPGDIEARIRTRLLQAGNSTDIEP